MYRFGTQMNMAVYSSIVRFNPDFKTTFVKLYPDGAIDGGVDGANKCLNKEILVNVYKR